MEVMAHTSTSKYLKLAEASRYLGVSRQRVSLLVRTGRIPAIQTPLGRAFSMTRPDWQTGLA